MEPIYTYKRYGYEVTAHQNRIEFSEKPGLMPAKLTTILLKNVSGIDMSRLNKELTYRMNDGTKQKVKVYGNDAQALYDATIGLI